MASTPQLPRVLSITEKTDFDQRRGHLNAHEDNKGRLLDPPHVAPPEPCQFALNQLGKLARLVNVLGDDQVSQ